jgi:hypothetical protein
MPNKGNKPKNPHAVALGRAGGKAGTGESKRRSTEQMKKAGRLGGLARWRNERAKKKKPE